MNAPFVTRLRARPSTIRLPDAGADAITIRVEVAEVWDAVRIEAAPTEAVLAVKRCALEALLPSAGSPDDFVVKLHGWEVLDEHQTLAAAGAVDGSILLLGYRRRRALR